MPSFARVLALLTLSAVAGCDAVEDVIDTIDPQPELQLTIANTIAPASRSTSVHVLVTVSNTGAASATNTLVSLTLPAGIDFFDEQVGTACPGSACESTDLLTWNVGELLPDESKTIALPIRSRSTPALSLRLDGTANADNADGVSASASWTAAEGGRGTVELSLDAVQTSVQPGASIPVRMTALNTSNRGYDNATVVFTAPAGFEIADAGSGTSSGQTVRWTLGRMDPYGTADLDFTLRAPASLDAGEQHVLRARITSSTEALSGEAAYPLVAVDGEAAGLSVSADLRTIPLGGRSTVNISVTNPLGRTVNEGTAYVRLPDYIRFFDEPPGANCPGSACEGGDAMTLLLGSLAPGQTRTYSFVIDPDLNAGQAAFLSLTATAGGTWEGGFAASNVSSRARTLTWRVERE